MGATASFTPAGDGGARPVSGAARVDVPSLVAGPFMAALLLVVSWLPPSPLSGQVPQAEPDPSTGDSRTIPMIIPRISGPIELDGIVDEAAWEAVEPVPMIVFAPTYHGPITEPSEVRIAHDDRFLYVSGRMYDSDPDGIRANTFYRDRYSGDDALAIIVDSYNDYETAVMFLTNPAGTRVDRTVYNDAQFTVGGGLPMNGDWNSYWDVATSRTGEGWFAEFRIPFSTLGFQVLGEEVTMGLIIYRMIARKDERHLFPDIDPGWGGVAFVKPSQAQRIALQNVRQQTPVYATPYVLGGVRRTPKLADGPRGPESVWDAEQDGTREAGLDIKYSPTSNLALNLTANTDFAQVEADSAQINIERFPLFIPEKRQFFQERSATFDFNTGGPFNRLFHSRQIGLHEGEIVKIYGGVRAVGRIGGTDYGLLNMQTGAHGSLSSENMGVVRLRQQVLNPYSTVGAMVTSRLGSHGGDNVAYGLDASVRVAGDEYALLQWAQTFDEATTDATGLETGLMRARWERRRDAGFTYSADAVRVGSDYRPGLGFQRRTGFNLGGLEFAYGEYMDASSMFRRRGVRLTARQFTRNSDGTPESREVYPRAEVQFKGGARLDVGVRSQFESVRDPFPISDVEVAAGEYWFHEVAANFMLSRSDDFRGRFTASAGTFYDGSRIGVSAGPVWNVSGHLELGMAYSINRIDFPERDLATTTHLAQLKVELALDTHLSLSTYTQYNGVDDLTSINTRIRYHFSEGTDLWVVYSEGLHTERDQNMIPRTPLSSGRAFSVKYSKTLSW